MVEQRICNPCVRGSIPLSSTKNFVVGVVTVRLARQSHKLKIAGSNPAHLLQKYRRDAAFKCIDYIGNYRHEI